LTGTLPFELNYGDHPLMAANMLQTSTMLLDIPATDIFISDMALKLCLAHDSLVSTQAKASKYANMHSSEGIDFQVGDLVLPNSKHIHIEVSTILDSNKKFHYKFLGLFLIHKILIPCTTFELDIPHSHQMHPIFHISKLRKYISSNDIKDF
jgi:hypothetical protein